MKSKPYLSLLGLALFSTTTACSADGTDAISMQMKEAAAFGADGKPVVLDGDPGYSFHFTINGNNYFVSDNGNGIQENTDGSKHKFHLSVPSDMWIDGPVYFISYRGDYLILYEISDAEDGSAEMARIDGKTLSVKWTASDMAFNVAPALISGDTAYVAAIGFVGAIDLESGRYDWCLKDVYQGGNVFDAFDTPKIRNKAVIAVEDKLSRAPNGEPYYLWIDWKIGKVVTNANLAKPIKFLPGCVEPKS